MASTAELIFTKKDSYESTADICKYHIREIIDFSRCRRENKQSLKFFFALSLRISKEALRWNRLSLIIRFINSSSYLWHSLESSTPKFDG